MLDTSCQLPMECQRRRNEYHILNDIMYIPHCAGCARPIAERVRAQPRITADRSTPVGPNCQRSLINRNAD